MPEMLERWLAASSHFLWRITRVSYVKARHDGIPGSTACLSGSATRSSAPNLAMKQTYLAKLVFALQAKRIAYNVTAAVGETLPLLDHALLVRAAGHM